MPRISRLSAAGLLAAIAATAPASLPALAAANAWVLAVGRRRRARPGAEALRAEVAIVPGARVLPGGVPSVPLRERLVAALELWEAGRVGATLVSGDAHAREGDESEAMRRFLERAGVPPDALRVDGGGHRTLATLRHARAALGPGRAIVCTQAFHLPRALFLADRLGLDAVGLAVDRGRDPHALSNRAREILARGRAVVDAALLVRP